MGVAEDARTVVAAARHRPPTLGTGRLLCLDGPAGSGKTTLAAALQELTGSTVVHMDDLYDGWAGLSGVDARLASLLRPLAEGRPGSYRRYDWHAGAFAETHRVDPAELLVVEGVGSGSQETADLVTVLAWVDAPAGLRFSRGVERDGEALRGQWRAWMRDEEEHFAAHATRERAQVLVDGTGRRRARVVGRS